MLKGYTAKLEKRFEALQPIIGRIERRAELVKERQQYVFCGGGDGDGDGDGDGSGGGDGGGGGGGGGPPSATPTKLATKKRVEDASKITQFKVAVRTALLMRASRSGDADAVRVLLERLPKSSVNHCDHFKHTPL